MRAGKTAGEALDALLASDRGRDVRQVAMIDSRGNVAGYTGRRCIPGAGHVTGRNFSAQANLMLNETVWGAMASAFERARGDLASRMLAALDAAEAAGGDIRGRQSAAILIVRGESTGRPWADRVMDLRVEDHADPLVELRRLVELHRAYDHLNRGDLALERNDVEGALHEYGTAERMFPGNLEMKFWHAVALVNTGAVDASIPMFRDVFRRGPLWARLLPRLPGAGAMNADSLTVARILSAAARP
jgi:uncharacterized Ntn-hydrolase superfamily protein